MSSLTTARGPGLRSARAQQPVRPRPVAPPPWPPPPWPPPPWPLSLNLCHVPPGSFLCSGVSLAAQSHRGLPGLPASQPDTHLLTHRGPLCGPQFSVSDYLPRSVSLVRSPSTEHSACHVVGVKNNTTLETKALFNEAFKVIVHKTTYIVQIMGNYVLTKN